MTLDLDTLSKGIMGLTEEFGSFLLQACTICLDSQNHQSGVQMNLLTIQGNKVLSLNWSSVVNNQIKRNWSDMQEATEYAATGVAIKLAEIESINNCVERSSKGTGFDYWLGEENDVGIFQRKERLEISGILNESKTNTVANRVNAKIRQTNVSKETGLNVHICVVEFGNTGFLNQRKVDLTV